jgi:hypothetical protein
MTLTKKSALEIDCTVSVAFPAADVSTELHHDRPDGGFQ